jgi:hypothetical protein
MKQFEFRQISLQQNSVPVLPGYEHRDLIQLHDGTRVACALRVEAEVKRAHILHLNCDMQMNFPNE